MRMFSWRGLALLLAAAFLSAVTEAAAQSNTEQAAQMQQTIDQYNKQLAGCGGKKSEQCAYAMYILGNTYYQQATTNAAAGAKPGGRKYDFSMAVPMYQRLLNEYPNSQYSPSAKQMLTTIEKIQLKAAAAALQTTPAQQDTTVQQVTPVQPEASVQPAAPIQHVATAQPAAPAPQVVPAQQVAPVQPAAPIQHVAAAQPAAPAPLAVAPAQSAYGTPKIAVYVFGAEMTLNKAVATQIVTTLAGSGRYQPAEDYKEFFNQAAVEQNDGKAPMNSKLIKKLGQQFGAEYVCVAEITTVFGEKQATAHVYNVKTGEIAASGVSDVPLRTQADVPVVSEQIVNTILKKAQILR
jgi:hypothetical protein